MLNKNKRDIFEGMLNMPTQVLSLTKDLNIQTPIKIKEFIKESYNKNQSYLKINNPLAIEFCSEFPNLKSATDSRVKWFVENFFERVENSLDTTYMANSPKDLPEFRNVRASVYYAACLHGEQRIAKAIAKASNVTLEEALPAIVALGERQGKSEETGEITYASALLNLKPGHLSTIADFVNHEVNKLNNEEKIILCIATRNKEELIKFKHSEDLPYFVASLFEHAAKNPESSHLDKLTSIIESGIIDFSTKKIIIDLCENENAKNLVKELLPNQNQEKIIDKTSELQPKNQHYSGRSLAD